MVTKFTMAKKPKAADKRGTRDEKTVAVEEEQDVPVLLVTEVSNILKSVFSNVEVYINNQYF